MIEIKVDDEETLTCVSINIQAATKEVLACQMVALQAKLREAVNEMVPEEELETWVDMLSTAMRDGVPLEEVEE